MIRHGARNPGMSALIIYMQVHRRQLADTRSPGWGPYRRGGRRTAWAAGAYSAVIGSGVFTGGSGGEMLIEGCREEWEREGEKSEWVSE